MVILFSGKNIAFNYDDFSFDFNNNSVLSFVNENLLKISSSLIYFDDGQLLIDSCGNKSGLKSLNNFPRFQVSDNSYFAYVDKAISFVMNPFQIKCLHDISLKI